MLQHLGPHCQPDNEWLDVCQARGRITGTMVRALRSSPHYAAAAMDGYAVRARATFGISEREPRWFTLNHDAVAVDTGDPMPGGYDAVIMLEEILETTDEAILVQQAVVPWDNVRPVGEDIVAGEVLLPINHQLRPQDQGALLAAGVTKVQVRRKPRVGILPTGDEIRPPEQNLNVGEISDSNSTVIAGMVEEWGGISRVWPIAADRPGDLEEALLDMAESQDIIVVIAGSSQGRDDYTAKIIGQHGEIYLHGAAIKPGKPVILGMIQQKPVIGLPGYPVSAFITARLFLEPWVRHWQGLAAASQVALPAVLSKKVFSSLGSEEFVRVKVGRVGQRWIATPLTRGAGVTMSLVRADGIIRVPRLQEGFHEGATVEVELLRPLEELAQTLVGIGSHDLSLDVLTDHLKRSGGTVTIASAHVGSLAGLLALRKGEAHFAGIHLLDPDSGEYNLTYVNRFLPGRKLALVNLVYRTQGLLVAPGNPLDIKGLGDLTREGLRFVNRQGGSGTRILLDYLLRQMGITKEQILGYEREEYTHLGVGVAIAAGSADVGLGIQSAAAALGLDFIPVGEERYDLAIPEECWQETAVQDLLRIIAGSEFQTEVLQLGGYDVRDSGKITKIGNW